MSKLGKNRNVPFICGQALVVALIVMAIVTVLAAGFMAVSRTAYMINQVNLDNDAAYYLASSGIEFIKYQLSKNFTNYPSGATTINLSGGKTVTVEVGNAAGGVREVKVTAAIGSTQQQIVKKYKINTKDMEVCWVTTGSHIVEIASSGEILLDRVPAHPARFVSVNVKDNICWFGTYAVPFISRIDSVGNETSFNIFNPGEGPWCIAANEDGTSWVATSSANGDVCYLEKVNADGSLAYPMHQIPSTIWPLIAADASNGECWLQDSNGTKRISPAGSIIRSKAVSWYGQAASVDPKEHTCWFTSWGDNKVYKIDSNLNTAWAPIKISSGSSAPFSVSVNPLNNSAWVMDPVNHRVVNISNDGSTITSIVSPSIANVYGQVSVNPKTGFCWVAPSDGTLAYVDSVTGNLFPICVPYNMQRSHERGTRTIAASSTKIQSIEETQ